MTSFGLALGSPGALAWETYHPPAVYDPKCELRLLAGAPLERKSQWLKTTFQAGAKSYHVLQQTAVWIGEQPRAEQQTWVQAIAAIYRQMPKEETAPATARRLMDRLLMYTQNWSARFEEILKQSTSASVAYSQAIAEQTALFGGRYDAQMIWSAIDAIQEVIVRLDAERATKGGPPPVVHMVGSFINGKGILPISDLDLNGNAQLLAYLQETMQTLDGEWRANYNQSAPRLELHALPLRFFVEHNAFAIEITTNCVTLKVFAPGPEVFGRGGPPGFAPGEAKEYKLRCK